MIIIRPSGLKKSQAEYSPRLSASLPTIQVVARVHSHSLEGYHCTDAQVSQWFLGPSPELCSQALAWELRSCLKVLEKPRVDPNRMGSRKEMGSIGCRYAEYDPELGLHHSWHHNPRPQACSCAPVVAVQMEGNCGSWWDVMQRHPPLIVQRYYKSQS